MVGAFYAAGMPPAELERLAHEIRLVDFFLEWRVIGGGPASGAAVQAYVNKKLGDRTLEMLQVPFVATATRVEDGRLAMFNRGDAGLAVRASGASPGQFAPVSIGAHAYVDGDEASPVPIRAARSLGAKFVIAVDVSAYLADTPPDVPRDWVVKDERRTRQVAEEAPQADIVLHPNIGYYAGHDEAYRRRVIEAAERYTREQMPAVRAALARAGLPAPRPQKSAMAARPSGDASR
jgi:NTE family protein